MLLSALINLVVVGGTNTSLFNVSIMMMLPSYVKGNYDFYDVEQIEEFIAWKGAFELASLLENIDDSPYKY